MCGDRSSSTPPLLYRRKSPGLTTNTSGPSSALKAVCSFGPPTYWEFGTNCRRTCASLFWFHWVTSRSNHSFWAALAPRGAKNCQKLSAALERSLVSGPHRSEEHTSELQSRGHLVCRLLLEKEKDGRQLSSSYSL